MVRSWIEEDEFDNDIKSFQHLDLAPVKDTQKESVFKAGDDPDLYLDVNIDEAMITESKVIRSPVI